MSSLVMLVSLTATRAADAPATKLNALFIALDDLNHWVGHHGRDPQAKTPNIDRLAAMGVTFTNAHCAAPVCNPSRAALKAYLAKRLPRINLPAPVNSERENSKNKRNSDVERTEYC
jgi:hypothetical protein